MLEVGSGGCQANRAGAALHKLLLFSALARQDLIALRDLSYSPSGRCQGPVTLRGTSAFQASWLRELRGRGHGVTGRG